MTCWFFVCAPPLFLSHKSHRHWSGKKGTRETLKSRRGSETKGKKHDDAASEGEKFKKFNLCGNRYFSSTSRSSNETKAKSRRGQKFHLKGAHCNLQWICLNIFEIISRIFLMLCEVNKEFASITSFTNSLYHVLFVTVYWNYHGNYGVEIFRFKVEHKWNEIEFFVCTRFSW